MLLQLRGRGGAAREIVRAHVERRLTFALGRLRRRIRRVRVFLARLNRSRAGVTRRCVMVVELAGTGRVVVDHRDAGWRTAVGTAARRLGRAVRRRLALRRRGARRPQRGGLRPGFF